MKRYEQDFPLKHPRYIIENVGYKNRMFRIMAWGHPWIKIGRSFEELREILDRVTLSEKMGVCLDTCHIWDAGYNIADDLDGVLTQFDKVIGLHRLYAVHLNDSMNPCGAHKDRHQKLGQGCIGLDALVRVVNHPALKHLPFILETPNEDAGYAAEIALMREKSE